MLFQRLRWLGTRSIARVRPGRTIRRELAIEQLEDRLQPSGFSVSGSVSVVAGPEDSAFMEFRDLDREDVAYAEGGVTAGGEPWGAAYAYGYAAHVGGVPMAVVGYEGAVGGGTPYGFAQVSTDTSAEWAGYIYFPCSQPGATARVTFWADYSSYDPDWSGIAGFALAGGRGGYVNESGPFTVDVELGSASWINAGLSVNTRSHVWGVEASISISGAVWLHSVQIVDPDLGPRDPECAAIYSSTVITPEPHGTDIAVTSLDRDATTGDVTFSYAIAYRTLPTATTVALFWASGPTFADRIGGPVYSVLADAEVGTHGPIFVSAASLGDPPVGATHLLVVADPDDLLAERDEDNNVLALAIV